MIDLFIKVLDPNLNYLGQIDVNSIVFQRLVEMSGAFVVLLAFLMLYAIYKVLTAFFR